MRKRIATDVAIDNENGGIVMPCFRRRACGEKAQSQSSRSSSPHRPARLQEYRNATLGTVQATLPDTHCFYFTLAGVSQADPVVSGSPWFAISRNQNLE